MAHGRRQNPALAARNRRGPLRTFKKPSWISRAQFQLRLLLATRFALARAKPAEPSRRFSKFPRVQALAGVRLRAQSTGGQYFFYTATALKAAVPNSFPRPSGPPLERSGALVASKSALFLVAPSHPLKKPELFSLSVLSEDLHLTH